MTKTDAQQADWNGESGERWVAHQHRLDAMVAPFGQAALQAAAPAMGERVLDVGCGAGASTRALATLVGSEGQVLGIDISAPLIRRARESVPMPPSVRFEVGDASRAPLPDGAFDLLFSRFGVMFFDEPASAFAHLRRALRPGGRMAFVCWRKAGENPWVSVPMKALAGLLPRSQPPEPNAPGPFSFGDPARVTGLLSTAGFVEIALAPFDAPVSLGTGQTRDEAIDDAVTMTLDIGPLSRLLASQPDPVRDRALAAIRAAFADHASERSVTVNGAAWIVTARSPAG